jgi:hypothetical protein
MFPKKLIVLTALVALSPAVVPAAVASADDAPSAADIVAASDKVRNPQQPFRVSLSLVEYQSGQAHDAVDLAVHSKIDASSRQYRNLVRYAAPARDAGKLVLLSASSMWFYDPASKASIRISAQQRLIGQASDGDVLTVNLAHDYAPKLVGEESIQDADHQARRAWHLDLAASTSDAQYTRLETWVEKETYRPIKAKFYSDSGRLLKLAYYRKFEAQLGASRPMETIIVDAVDSHLVTKITYSDYRAEQVQDAWFQREYLPRFAEE